MSEEMGQKKRTVKKKHARPQAKEKCEVVGLKIVVKTPRE